MMKKSVILLLLGAFFSTTPSFSQSTQSATFTIGSDSYYIHQISYQDVSNIKPGNYVWNQNMVADNQYIYLADHTDNSATHLTIKRFSAIDGSRVSDIVINKENLEYYFIDTLTDDERCFYLCQCNDNDHFILFLNTNADGIDSEGEFYFYLIDKEGNITNEFQAINVPGNEFIIGDFGIPAVIGNPGSGDFEILIPMRDMVGNFKIVNYAYYNGKQKSYSVLFYSSNDDGTDFTKPTIQIVDDRFMILDDNYIYPSLYSYIDNPSVCFGTLDINSDMGHGIKVFNFDGHRLLCSGDVLFPGGSTKNGTTQFNIGLWDNDSSPAQIKSRAASTIDFSDYQPLTSLQFGKSSLQSGSSSTYRQFAATSQYGNDVTHLHMYVPGEFLATYQINKQLTPTSVDEIKKMADRVSFSISDRIVSFDRLIDNVSVFDTMGRIIFSSQNPVKSINFSNFVKGLYIIHTDNQSFKIII